MRKRSTTTPEGFRVNLFADTEGMEHLAELLAAGLRGALEKLPPAPANELRPLDAHLVELEDAIRAYFR